MRTLQNLTIKNFKSIRDQSLDLGQLNIFIGGNGAGKSNLVTVFKFLHEIVNQRLAEYTLRRGGADTILHFGRATSRRMEFSLKFGEGAKANGYKIVLQGTDEDGLIVESEIASYHERHKYPSPYELPISVFINEAKIRTQNDLCARQVVADLDSYRVYHFHDTSDTAPVKALCNVDDNRYLRPQAENLAAFLYWLQEKQPDHFSMITDTVPCVPH